MRKLMLVLRILLALDGPVMAVYQFTPLSRAHDAYWNRPRISDMRKPVRMTLTRELNGKPYICQMICDEAAHPFVCVPGKIETASTQ